MMLCLATSLAALATTAFPDPALRDQGYATCAAKCAGARGAAPCKTWDWDPSTNKCHFSSSSDPRVGEAPGAAAPRASPAAPSPALQKLIAKYAALQNASCAQVLQHVPSFNAGDVAAFMAAYQQYKGGGTGGGNETSVLVAARKLMTPALNAFLSLPDSTSGPDGLDAAMVRCAVLRAAAGSNALAEYAVQGTGQEATVDQLLAEPVLMRDLLVAGGAAGGKYGEVGDTFTHRWVRAREAGPGAKAAQKAGRGQPRPCAPET